MSTLGGTADNHIETGVDRLLCLVNKHHELPLSRASSLLNVPREIVDSWSETLEDAQLIGSTITFGEKFLTSKEYVKAKGARSSLTRFVKCVSQSLRRPGRDDLARKEREVKELLATLECRIAELKRLNKINAEIETQKHELAMEKKRLTAEREALLKKSVEIGKRENALEDQANALKQKETQLATRSKTLAIDADRLKQRAREIEAKRKEINTAVANLLKVASNRQTATALLL